ncbi:hypothetical protein KM043_008130 [Ampulex compressa]|nr:hypothetical protein KM043_008130 [Ampulex compressa]
MEDGSSTTPDGRKGREARVSVAQGTGSQGVAWTLSKFGIAFDDDLDDLDDLEVRPSRERFFASFRATFAAPSAAAMQAFRSSTPAIVLRAARFQATSFERRLEFVAWERRKELEALCRMCASSAWKMEGLIVGKEGDYRVRVINRAISGRPFAEESFELQPRSSLRNILDPSGRRSNLKRRFRVLQASCCKMNHANKFRSPELSGVQMNAHVEFVYIKAVDEKEAISRRAEERQRAGRIKGVGRGSTAAAGKWGRPNVASGQSIVKVLSCPASEIIVRRT